MMSNIKYMYFLNSLIKHLILKKNNIFVWYAKKIWSE